MTLWRGGAILVLLMLLAGGVPVTHFRYLYTDRDRLGSFLRALPDSRTPSYPQFLDQVRQHTSPGDSVAILVPMRYWNEGYAYAYFRASYLLADRKVVPLVDANDRLLLNRLDSVDYVAAWRQPAALGSFREVWKGPEGILLERIR